MYKWDISKGDFEPEIEDYIRRHEKVLKRERLQVIVFKSLVSMTSIGLILLVLHLVSNLTN